ncbi:hypothetical protein [Mycoplasma feriruminatoris]|uniref:Uncharacterized protein n=2 Tax=Mycoplasma feriruminatoris TaxID=1179777 RepID=A0A654IRY9_9MOLU|nr:hypothetical protein [Mycoplasma feriruminatoris]WFQ91333.1 hypothetical protein MFERI13461_00771 [Mycoplasma feriruminatoris]WFQ92159.1 hypothetical protein MFERI14815_00776 [Mycoplasma feriruminatoris]WFQ94687.1 hypothetical protein MFERI15220_00769 [Mycoplasma feriruminatoris]WFQ95514.1 hypothetical protein MFERI15407_00775 [Mycoplasma feriruminatoris]WFQ96332.1 hypothetical protein MFERI15568_00769 [Mycoplasma feriruminatoris]
MKIQKRSIKSDAIFYSIILALNLLTNFLYWITHAFNVVYVEVQTNLDIILALDSSSIAIWGLWITTFYAAICLYFSFIKKQLYQAHLLELFIISMLISTGLIFVCISLIREPANISNWSALLRVINVHFLLPISMLLYLIFFRTNVIVSKKSQLIGMWRILAVGLSYITWITYRTVPNVQENLIDKPFLYTSLQPSNIGWALFMSLSFGSFILYFLMYLVIVLINNKINDKFGGCDAKTI